MTGVDVLDRLDAVGRYYDPSTAQFMSVDPDVAVTGQPYVYVGDDPVNEVDPLGLNDCGSFSFVCDVGNVASAGAKYAYHNPGKALAYTAAVVGAAGLVVATGGAALPAIAEGAGALATVLGTASVAISTGAAAFDCSKQINLQCAGDVAGIVGGGLTTGAGALLSQSAREEGLLAALGIKNVSAGQDFLKAASVFFAGEGFSFDVATLLACPR